MRVMVIYPPDEALKSEKKFVIETKANDLIPALDETFRRFNADAVDGTEDCVKFRVRSLSVGDVIKAPCAPEGKFYLIMGCGYKEITSAELAEVRGLPFAERAIKYMGKGNV